MPSATRRRFTERAWISMFLVSAFLFAVLAPPWAGIPLSLAAGGLGALDAFVHRGLVGAAWLTAAITFGLLCVVLAVVAAVTGAANGLEVFTP